MADNEAKEELSVMKRVISLSELILGFFENGETNPETLVEGSDEELNDFGEQRRVFWESQHRILEGLLSKSNSLEKRIRQKTESALRLLRSESGSCCSCSRNSSDSCKDCLLRGITERLRNAGFNSAICRSKWKSSSLAKGEHAYIDVMEDGEESKGPVRVIVEICFRAEFEMARGSEEYRCLVNRLPEVFIGKPERLRMVLKNVCAAAKKCMEDNNMHMPPWRKFKHMQAKWLSPCERESRAAAGRSISRASVLTYDLLDKFPGFRSPAVQVL